MTGPQRCAAESAMGSSIDIALVFDTLAIQLVLNRLSDVGVICLNGH